MTISDFLQKKNMTHHDFAQAIGVSESIVRLWDQSATSPRLLHALRINAYTKNKVKFSEMLNNKERGEFHAKN